MNPSVASVTVAYNAERILSRQMDALKSQSRPLDEIIVVDNGSTDGTGAMLAERYPDVTVLKMKQNLGAAGGWAAGLEYATLKKRHDWVWSFDGDSVPAEDSLQALLRGFDSLGDGAGVQIGVIAPLPVHEDSGELYAPLFWRDGFVRPTIEEMRRPVWFTDMVILSGCMVRNALVEKVGLPRADFFMDFADFEYCLRARASGFRIAVVSDSKLEHEIGDATPIRFLGHSRLWPNHSPWREYYISRNITYTAWQLHASRKAQTFVLKHLARHAVGILLFATRKLKCLIRMAQGFSDGQKGRLGIRFRPQTLGHKATE